MPGRCQYRTLLLPIIRPAVAVLLPTPVLIYGLPAVLPMVGGRLAVALLIVTAVYGGLYAMLVLVFVLKPEEKKRFTGVITRRLRPTRGNTSPQAGHD